MPIRIECGLDSRSRAGFWKKWWIRCTNFFSFKKVAKTWCGLDSRIYGISHYDNITRTNHLPRDGAWRLCLGVPPCPHFAPSVNSVRFLLCKCCRHNREEMFALVLIHSPQPVCQHAVPNLVAADFQIPWTTARSRLFTRQTVSLPRPPLLHYTRTIYQKTEKFSSWLMGCLSFC
jgi:hypothetical protein